MRRLRVTRRTLLAVAAVPFVVWVGASAVALATLNLFAEMRELDG